MAPLTPPTPLTQVAKEKQAGAGLGMIQYVQGLPTEEAQQLTSQVSKEVLDAMAQLITSLLKEADVQPDAVMETSDLKMRELLVWQVRVLSTWQVRSRYLTRGHRLCTRASALTMHPVRTYCAQLVTGYKLRELEVKEELKDKFWGAEVADKA